MIKWKLIREIYPYPQDLTFTQRAGTKKTIGRAQADIVCQSDFVSRRHCSITCKDGLLYIRDGDGSHFSTNGTFLNGQKIPNDMERELRHGDLVGVGVADLTDCESSEHFLFRFLLSKELEVRPASTPIKTEPEVITLDDEENESELSDVTTGVQENEVDNKIAFSVPISGNDGRIDRGPVSRGVIPPPPPRISSPENLLTVTDLTNLLPAVNRPSSKCSSKVGTSPPNGAAIIADGQVPSTSRVMKRQMESSLSHKAQKRIRQQLVSSSSGDDSSDGLTSCGEGSDKNEKKSKDLRREKETPNDKLRVDDRKQKDLGTTESRDHEHASAALVKKQWQGLKERRITTNTTTSGEDEVVELSKHSNNTAPAPLAESRTENESESDESVLIEKMERRLRKEFAELERKKEEIAARRAVLEMTERHTNSGSEDSGQVEFVGNKSSGRQENGEESLQMLELKHIDSNNHGSKFRKERVQDNASDKSRLEKQSLQNDITENKIVHSNDQDIEIEECSELLLPDASESVIKRKHDDKIEMKAIDQASRRSDHREKAECNGKYLNRNNVRQEQSEQVSSTSRSKNVAPKNHSSDKERSKNAPQEDRRKTEKESRREEITEDHKSHKRITDEMSKENAKLKSISHSDDRDDGEPVRKKKRSHSNSKSMDDPGKFRENVAAESREDRLRAEFRVQELKRLASESLPRTIVSLEQCFKISDSGNVIINARRSDLRKISQQCVDRVIRQYEVLRLKASGNSRRDSRDAQSSKKPRPTPIPRKTSDRHGLHHKTSTMSSSHRLAEKKHIQSSSSTHKSTESPKSSKRKESRHHKESSHNRYPPELVRPHSSEKSKSSNRHTTPVELNSDPAKTESRTARSGAHNHEDARIKEVTERIQKNEASNAKKIQTLDHSPAPRKMRGHDPPRPLSNTMTREHRTPNTPPVSFPEEPKKPIPVKDKRMLLKQLVEKNEKKKAEAEAMAKPVKPVINAPLKVRNTKKSRNDVLLESMETLSSQNQMQGANRIPLERRTSAGVSKQADRDEIPSTSTVSAFGSRNNAQSLDLHLNSGLPSLNTEGRLSGGIPPVQFQRNSTDHRVELDESNVNNLPIPYTEDQVFRDILNWSPEWINAPGKNHTDQVTNNGRLVKNLPLEFKDHQSYANTFHPLMLLELWESLSFDYREFMKKQRVDGTSTEKYSYQIGVELEGKAGQCPMLNKNYRVPQDLRHSELGWHWIRVMTLVEAAEDIDTQNDFGTLSLYIQGRCGDTQKRTFFGFFLKSSECFEDVTDIRNASVHNSFSSLLNEGNTVKYSIDVMVNLRGNSLNLKKPGEVNRFTYLAPILQNFRAVSWLPQAKLFKNIIDPSTNYREPLSPATSTADLCQRLQKDVLDLLKGRRQREVVGHISSRILEAKRPEVMLVHGPPGSGKTSTIAGLALQILSELPIRPHKRRLLICAPTPLALDQVVLKMKPFLGLRKLARFGEGCIETKMFSLLELANASVNENHAEQFKESIRTISRNVADIYKSQTIDDTHREKLALLKERRAKHKSSLEACLEDEKTRITKTFLDADIVCATLSSCSDPMFREHFGGESNRSHHFTCCIVDEACNATEPESLVPVMLNCDQLVLFGDPKQHRGYVKSKEADARDFHQSLFSRMYNFYQKPTQSRQSPVYSLSVQFRMNRNIMRWPNLRFYNKSMVIHDSLDNVPKLRLTPYVFLDVRVSSSESASLTRRDTVAISVVREILLTIKRQRTIDEKHIGLSIGVLTPTSMDIGDISDLINDLRKDNSKYWNSIEIGTVDQFQGREKDIIILFCIQTEKVGNLLTPERLNVALTRAKRCLYIVGNAFRLEKDENWKSLIKDANNLSVIKPITEAELAKPYQFRRSIEKIILHHDQD